ncbi:MAG: hypothetical protein LLG06_18555 [Desulfobacteraceae bacterium]|nr:hypothetical protein [Desulfobacteraceae bacterium]
MHLDEGGKYCLPNGEKVIARKIEGRFVLEFKRTYRPPLSVGDDGTLFLRGESTGFTLDSLSTDEEG